MPRLIELMGNGYRQHPHSATDALWLTACIYYREDIFNYNISPRRRWRFRYIYNIIRTSIVTKVIYAIYCLMRFIDSIFSECLLPNFLTSNTCFFHTRSQYGNKYVIAFKYLHKILCQSLNLRKMYSIDTEIFVYIDCILILWSHM